MPRIPRSSAMSRTRPRQGSTARPGRVSSTHRVEVLDPITRRLVLPERRLVLLAVKHRRVVKQRLLLRLLSSRDGGVHLLLPLQHVDRVDIVRHRIELGRLTLDVVGDLRCVDHGARSQVGGGGMREGKVSCVFVKTAVGWWGVCVMDGRWERDAVARVARPPVVISCAPHAFPSL